MSGDVLPSRRLAAWLLADDPASRRQAAWGRLYRGFRAFLGERLAVGGLLLLLFLLAVTLAAPWLGASDPTRPDLAHRLAPPSWQHWLGTDEMGRDLYARLLYGGRITLGMVVAVAGLIAPFGLFMGLIAGYAGGIVDLVFMRICDIFLALPRLVLALAFVAAWRPGIMSAVVAIALTGWPPYARLARAEALLLRQSEAIAAIRLMGASNWRILFRHIAPLSLPSLIVRLTLEMSGIILTVAGLGFLGMGAQPPLPEWGAMVAAGRPYLLTQWWVPTVPGLAIVLAALGFNLLGDGLRRLLDPKAG